MGLLAENPGVCLPFLSRMFFVLCVLGGKKLAVESPPSRCPWLPSGAHASCLATSSSGSSKQVSACVPHEGPFVPVPCDPASSLPSSLLLSVGRVQLGLTVPHPPVRAAGAEGAQTTLVSRSLASFLLYIQGNAKERWLLTWRGCNGHLTLLPATCLSDRR